jgi:hypothetical protein
MDVVGRGPVRVGSLLWQPAPGAFALTVVAKLTFELAPGESPLADEPEHVYDADAHWDDDPARSLVPSTELVPGKARPEVLLMGSAYAPNQASVAAMTVRLALGDVDKSARVCGDRWFSADGVLSEPASFARMPLSWERAAGGPETANPVGLRMGQDARSDAWGRTQVPNLEPMGAPLAERHQVLAPVGFGPMAPTWRPRLAHLLHRAPAWDPARWSQAPLPGGFDFGFWNTAPADQHLSELRGDEQIFLENLDRRTARLATRLAKARVHARVEWAGGGGRDLPFVLPDTLIIATDRGLAMLVYRGAVALDHPQRAGRVTIEATVEAAPRRAVWSGADLGSTQTDAGQSASPKRVPAAIPQAWSRSIEDPVTDVGGETVAVPKELMRAALPFAQASASPAAPPAAREPASEPSPDDVSLPFRRNEGAKVGGSALGRSMRLAPPAQSFNAPPAPAPSFNAPSGPAAAVSSFNAPSEPPARAPSFNAPPAPSFNLPPAPVVHPFNAPPAPVVHPFNAPPAPVVHPFNAPPAPVAHPFNVPPAPVVSFDPPPEQLDPPEPPAAAIADTVRPPPMVGPLATPEMGLAEAPLAPLVIAGPPAVDGADLAAAAVAPPPPLPLDDVPLPRCAALDASMARRSVEAAEILHTARLDDATWRRVKAHYAEAIRAEARRGKTTSLKAYDRAYVAQLEAERGALREAEFARIAVAAERGESRAALAELELPAEALPRIQRVWIANMARDAALGAKVREAIDRVRAE